MTVRKKTFRIETMSHSAIESGGNDNFVDPLHEQVLNELSTIKSLISNRKINTDDGDDPSIDAADTIAEGEVTHLKSELHEAQKLKVELDAMYHAISETKREIASLHSSSFDGQNMNRVTDELDEVVVGTENATEKILSAVEMIDEDAANLFARLKGGDREMVADIQEKVVNIFEACNFQDLTGQRITKVVNALRFVEERIEKMMSIWGGIDSFQEIETTSHRCRQGDNALLNGPSLSHDENVASQDDIDALFS